MRQAIVSLLTLWLLGGGVQLVHGQRTGEFSFVMLPDGTPRFTQVLRWEGEPDVLYYDVTVQTASGAQVVSTRVEKPALPLSLSPGAYRYRIVLYNLLRQPEIRLPWQDFVVLMARSPRITNAAPKMWFIEDPHLVVELSGRRLMTGMTVVLKPENGRGQPVTGHEIERNGTSTVKVAFSALAVSAGEYAVGVTNPGGLSFTFPNAILVRHKLPPPSNLEPATGTVYGPGQLRGMKSIRFSWSPVAGAVKYTFCLYDSARTKPVVRIDSLTGSSYLLKNLSVLDNGAFRWTVDAQGNDPSRGVIPSVRPAAATFTIDLPPLAAPALPEGSIYYGR